MRESFDLSEVKLICKNQFCSCPALPGEPYCSQNCALTDEQTECHCDHDACIDIEQMR